MCGIVAGIAQRDVVPILLEGLKRLEYRGYDSAGLAVITPEEDIYRCRALGKVSELEKALLEEIEGKPKLSGTIGIAHTRWATHGAPAERNAHPHVSKDKIAVVHNGIIENYQVLKQQQIKRGYHFTSETDTEVIAHQIHWHLESVSDTEQAIKLTLADLRGAYALAVLNEDDPDRLFVVRKGSPVVIGVGIGEHFVASDVSALLPVTNQFIFLEEGDFAAIEKDSLSITNAKGLRVERSLKESDLSVHDIDRGTYRHFMLKEIFEQPVAVAATLEGRIHNEQVMDTAFGHGAGEIFDSIDGVLILACGTSYHAGMVARYWFESLAGIPCSIEVASEFRYRKSVVKSNTLVLVISQSGETADTIAALSKAKEMGCRYFLAICNVPESRLVRESDLALMTRAGPEIGVASTKAFTTQLVALLMLVIALGRRHGMSEIEEKGLVAELISLPSQIEKALELSEEIKQVAESFSEKHHALFLGRGELYPIAMEGALKLKEISYIHAEAYPAGELKHGPLALVDDEMPVIAVAPNDELLEKLNSNIQEVRARGGKLFVFTGAGSIIEECEDVNVTEVAVSGHSIAPIILTIPLQLLAYYVALIKGTDIDQPRNLAKSVTVE